jgi:hypothetical protein
MIIDDCIEQDPAVESAFNEMGLKCPECIAKYTETMKDIARLYERDLEKLLAELAKKTGGTVVETLPIHDDE